MRTCVALDASTGKVLWDHQVEDYSHGYSMTSAPLPIGDAVIVGVGGGDFPVRGFIEAYDAATGTPRWRFHTIPEPGEPGNETWGNGSWKTGGGGAWGIGAYDPELGLIYWGIGNPAPDYNPRLRPGDNLYSNSVVALEAASGKLRWHFQFSPSDDHDWDSTQTPSLIDLKDNGTVQKLLAVANRNGFFYVLDRQTGRFIRGAAYARQTWASGLSATGRPLRLPNADPTPQGVFLYPSVSGATNWWPSAYSPATQLYYVNVLESGGLFFAIESPPRIEIGHMYTSGAARAVEGETAAALRARHRPADRQGTLGAAQRRTLGSAARRTAGHRRRPRVRLGRAAPVRARCGYGDGAVVIRHRRPHQCPAGHLSPRGAADRRSDGRSGPRHLPAQRQTLVQRGSCAIGSGCAR